MQEICSCSCCCRGKYALLTVQGQVCDWQTREALCDDFSVLSCTVPKVTRDQQACGRLPSVTPPNACSIAAALCSAVCSSRQSAWELLCQLEYYLVDVQRQRHMLRGPKGCCLLQSHLWRIQQSLVPSRHLSDSGRAAAVAHKLGHPYSCFERVVGFCGVKAQLAYDFWHIWLVWLPRMLELTKHAYAGQAVPTSAGPTNKITCSATQACA